MFEKQVKPAAIITFVLFIFFECVDVLLFSMKIKSTPRPSIYPILLSLVIGAGIFLYITYQESMHKKHTPKKQPLGEELL